MSGTFARLATAEELRSAEGRACILAITGLQHQQATYFFQVVGGAIRQVPPFERYNTYIGAPIDSVIRVLKGALEGDEHAFAREWTRGQAQLKGDYSIHDGYQFDEAFRRLARLVKRYKTFLAQLPAAQPAP